MKTIFLIIKVLHYEQIGAFRNLLKTHIRILCWVKHLVIHITT